MISRMGKRRTLPRREEGISGKRRGSSGKTQGKAKLRENRGLNELKLATTGGKYGYKPRVRGRTAGNEISRETHLGRGRSHTSTTARSKRLLHLLRPYVGETWAGVRIQLLLLLLKLLLLLNLLLLGLLLLLLLEHVVVTRRHHAVRLGRTIGHYPSGMGGGDWRALGVPREGGKRRAG